jgi:hypothetical protein
MESSSTVHCPRDTSLFPSFVCPAAGECARFPSDLESLPLPLPPPRLSSTPPPLLLHPLCDARSLLAHLISSSTVARGLPHFALPAPSLRSCLLQPRAHPPGCACPSAELLSRRPRVLSALHTSIVIFLLIFSDSQFTNVSQLSSTVLDDRANLSSHKTRRTFGIAVSSHPSPHVRRRRLDKYPSQRHTQEDQVRCGHIISYQLQYHSRSYCLYLRPLRSTPFGSRSIARSVSHQY